ncbi:MAG: hypothetical protein L0206_01280, partial [Actinobacteria bacterium]|nr:hypothetical protein [Actinomycetota bacterium]
MRRILHVFHGRHTAAHGPFGTAPLDVRGFRGADVSFWRGKGASAFGFTFEESVDQIAWTLCAGADADRDPGADTEDTLRLVFRRPYLRLRANASDLTSLWAVGSFDPNPLFEGAPSGIETASVDLGGYANNLVRFEDSGNDYAFVSLDTDGIAVVRIDDAGRPGGIVHLATIEDSTLGTKRIAGGASDALTVVDGLLVSVAIGSGRVDASGHGVTVFDAA